MTDPFGLQNETNDPAQADDMNRTTPAAAAGIEKEWTMADLVGVLELQLAIRSTDLEDVCTSPVYYSGDGTPVPMGRMHTKRIRLETGCCHARSVIRPSRTRPRVAASAPT